MWEVIYFHDDYDSVDTICCNACFLLAYPILVLLSTRLANGVYIRGGENEMNDFGKFTGSISFACIVTVAKLSRRRHDIFSFFFSPFGLLWSPLPPPFSSRPFAFSFRFLVLSLSLDCLI